VEARRAKAWREDARPRAEPSGPRGAEPRPAAEAREAGSGARRPPDGRRRLRPRDVWLRSDT